MRQTTPEAAVFTAAMLAACSAGLSDRVLVPLLEADQMRLADEAQAVALELNVYLYRTNRAVPVANMRSPWDVAAPDRSPLRPHTPEELAELSRRLTAASAGDVARVMEEFRKTNGRMYGPLPEASSLLRSKRELEDRRAWAAAELARLRREDAANR